MTEERKQELRQLLHEALANLEIRPYGGFEGLSITRDQYKRHLQQAWSSYSKDSLWVVQHFTVRVSGAIESKLLEFIKTELDVFIHDDKILSASIFVLHHDMGGLVSKSCQTDGDCLSSFLQQLLKIAIFQGIERALTDFEKCTRLTDGSFQSIVLLTGITSEAEIQVFDGVHLIPLSNSTARRPRCWGGLPNPNQGAFKKTLLVIDYSIFPIFHNPFLLGTTETKWEDKWDIQKERFRFEVKNREFSKFNETDFHEKFCQALSLACNSAVQIDTFWSYMAEEELFNINQNRSSTSFIHPSSADTVTIEKADINKAKCLYEKLINPNSDVREKLQIPIDRWIKSKTSKTAVDKIIDLGIAFEALYLSDMNKKTELSFRLRLYASWFLGKDTAHRQELMKDFSKIYDWRSEVVHTGKLPKKGRGKKKTPFTREEVEAFITNAQDLCRQSIMKILEDGKFPDWNSLILGEDTT